MDPAPNGGNTHKTSQLGNALSGKIMLSTIVILFSIILFIAFLHLYVRWHVRRCAARRSRRRRRPLVFAGESQPHPPSTFNRGLDPGILNSIPVILFRSGAGDEEYQMECTICLSVFEEEEKIRSLPRCGHLFHADCIGLWFYTHSNCPLCRSAVEEVKETAPIAADPASAPAEGSAQSDPCSSSSNSGVWEIGIELPARMTEGTSGQEEQEASGSGGQILKWPSSGIDMVRWLLLREIRANCAGNSGEEPDLESGEGAPPPPYSPAAVEYGHVAVVRPMSAVESWRHMV